MFNPNDFERAKNKALSLLSFKAYTEKGLRNKLKEKGYSLSVIDDVIERMKQDLLIDDFKLAERYADSLFNSKLYAEKAVRLKLREKGIDINTIEDVIESYSDRDDLGNAIKLLEQKFVKIRDEKTANRASTLLVRYGYDYSTIKDAIHAVREFEDENDI